MTDTQSSPVLPIPGTVDVLWFLLARSLSGRPATLDDVADALAAPRRSAEVGLEIMRDRGLAETTVIDRDPRSRWVVTPMGRGTLRSALAIECAHRHTTLGESPDVDLSCG